MKNNVQFFFSEQLLTAIDWATTDTLTAIWMNRVQNNAILVDYNTLTTPPVPTIVSFNASN